MDGRKHGGKGPEVKFEMMRYPEGKIGGKPHYLKAMGK